ncbi:DUF2931 family protein [Chitinophagaceae bacterium 26-R-25]|nr:DUF2931 family protein [Chitinophagaceae bacterium 26-R-25]
MKKSKLLLSLIILLMGHAMSTGCKPFKMEAKFDWSATLSAPVEYPMTVIKGWIGGNDYTQGLSDWGINNAGWGNEGRSIASGPDGKGVPDSLHLFWRSFAEHKFYKGSFALPKEKITAWFKEGFMDTYFDTVRKETYKVFIVGMGPEGRVTVWLQGGSGMQQEIARFRATEVLVKKEDLPEEEAYLFNEGFDESVMTDSMIIKKHYKAKLAQYGLPDPALYDDYEQRYQWQPVLELSGEGSTVSSGSIYMCNGEKQFRYQDEFPYKESRAIPYLFFLGWRDKTGKGHASWIVLTEDKDYWVRFKKGEDAMLPIDFERSEIRKAFKEKIDPNRPSKLVIRIPEPEKRVVEIFLQQDSITVPIKNIRHITN